MAPATLEQVTTTDVPDAEQARRVKIKANLAKKEKEKRLCERSYEHFIKSVWDILEPETPLIWGWHLTYLCNLMQSEIERIGRHEKKIWDIIIINVPPRSMKSWIFTRAAAAWAWIHFPWMRFMQGSYSDEFATDHAMECRDIIQSTWYHENWGDTYYLKTDQNTKHHFRTDRNGARFTFSTGSKATGRGANIVSWDDPMSVQQSESEAEIIKANKFWTRTIRNRTNNKEVDVIIVIQQRLAQNDTTGHILKTERGRNILHVCLPAEERDWISPPQLREYYTDGLLFPQRLSRAFLNGEKSDAFYYSGQYLQEPTPEEGGMFKRKNWRYWQWPGQNLPPVVEKIGDEEYYCEVVDRPELFDDAVTSWDMAFKKKKSNDEVSGHAIGKSGANFFVLEKEFYGHAGLPESCDEVRKLHKAFPFTSQCLIEDKANGPAIIETLEKEIAIKPIPANATDSPESRANATSKIQRSGNVILPHPQICPWVLRIVNNFAAYNPAVGGTQDHEVTSICQAVIYLRFNKPVWEQCRAKTNKLKIDWRNLTHEFILYISQWVNHDNSSSIMLLLYNSHTGKLFILDDLIISSSLPELIIHAINLKIRLITGGVISDYKKFLWIGNGKMFGREGASNSTQVQKNTMADSYGESHISVIDNSLYDERGAITVAAKLFAQKLVFFSEAARESSRQCCAWNIDGDNPAPGYGLARALCNTVFNLSYTGQFEVKKKKMQPYSYESQKFQKDLEMAEKTGQMDKFLSGRSMNKSTKVKDVNGWMQ